MNARALGCILVLLAGCAAHRPAGQMFGPDGQRLDCDATGDGFRCGPYVVGPHETGPEVAYVIDGPQAPTAASSAPTRVSRWQWFQDHDGPAIVVGTAIVVAIITHHGGHRGPAPASSTCGPGTGQACVSAPAACPDPLNGLCGQ